MDTPALSGTEQHEPSGRLMLHCLKGALLPPRSAETDTAPRETSPCRQGIETVVQIAGGGRGKMREPVDIKGSLLLELLLKQIN